MWLFFYYPFYSERELIIKLEVYVKYRIKDKERWESEYRSFTGIIIKAFNKGKVGATLNEADVIQEIRENIIEMKGMLENISMKSDLKMETFEEKLKVVNNRISDLESNQKWFVCAIIGAVITMLVSLFK